MFGFPTPENLDKTEIHSPIQTRNIRKVLELKCKAKLYEKSDTNFQKNALNDLLRLTHCLWRLNREIEDILVEYHDILARHRIDIGMNTELMFKITSKDSEICNSQNLTLPIHLKKDILVELNMMHN